MYGQAMLDGADAFATAHDAARDAAAAMGGGSASSALVFSTQNYPGNAVLRGVRRALPTARIAGCQAAAVFGCGRVSHDGIAVLVSDSLEMIPAAAPHNVCGTEAAMEVAVVEAIAGLGGGDPSIVLLLPDGVRGNSVAAARGAARACGSAVMVSGGGAGDDMLFRGTHQYCDDAVVTDSAVAVAIRARSPIGAGLQHGSVPVGEPMVVTESSGARLAQLDFVPAIDRYRSVAHVAAGDPASPESWFTSFAMRHPIGLAQGSGDEYVLRSPLSVTLDGALVCCSDIPPHSTIRVMESTPASLLAAATEAAGSARALLGPATPGAALVFACVSRDFMLGADAAGFSRELAAVTSGLGRSVPVVGCATFGSFGSLSGGLPQYHSKSVSVVALPND